MTSNWTPSNTVLPLFPPGNASGTAPAGASTFSNAIQSSANLAGFHGLGIPLAGGRRALPGVPIWAGPVRNTNGGSFRDIAYAFNETIVPDDELVATEMTKLWVQESLVQSRSINTGWNTSGGINYVLYPGYSNQEPDPRIVSVAGAGSTTAFRGLTYIVFYDFPLHLYSPGSIIPTIKAELVDIIANTVRVGEFTLDTSWPNQDDEPIIPNWPRNHSYFVKNVSSPIINNDDYDVLVVDLTNNIEIARNQITQNGSALAQLGVSGTSDGQTLVPELGYIVMTSTSGNSRPYHVIDPYSGVVLDTFGSNTGSTVDTATTAPFSRFRGFVSTSQFMRDRLMVYSGFTSHEIGVMRVANNGQISRAYYDPDALLGDVGTDGEVFGIFTGDSIGARTANFRGFGTVMVLRQTFIDRIVFQDGLNGDGSPVEVEATDPVHREPTTDPFTGLSFPGEYTDTVTFEDITNGSVTPDDNDGIFGSVASPISIDLSTDLADATAKTLSQRTVAWIEYTSGRDLTGFTYRGFGLNALTAGYGFTLVESTDGITWTALTLPSNLQELSFQDRNNPASVATNPSTAGVQEFLDSITVAKYVGIAMDQADYTGVSNLSLTGLSLHGEDGFEISDDNLLVVPALTVPLRQKIWEAPSGHSILMGMLEPGSEDLIVLWDNDADSTLQYITKLELIDDVKGNPQPTDPAGLGVNELWTTQLEFPIQTIGAYRNALEFSNLDNNSLGFVSGNSLEKFTLINLASGHQRVQDFTNWRLFGAGADEVGNIAISLRQSWNGSGSYLVTLGDESTNPFELAKVFPYMTTNNISIQQIVQWISQRVGFDVSEIETAGFGSEDEVIGLILTERTGFRGLIENLGRVFDFGAFESEGKIKFVKRAKGIGSFVKDYELTVEDLCPIDETDGFETNDPGVEVVRDPLEEQPGSVELRFIDPNAEYINSISTAKRTQFPISSTNADSLQPAQFSVPIVMTAAEARIRAIRLLYKLWIAAARLNFRLPSEYLDLEPTDTIVIPVDDVTYTVIAETTIINGDHTISIEAEAIASEEIPAIDSQDIINFNEGVQGSASTGFLLDLPPLIDGDVLTAEGTGITIYGAVSSQGQDEWIGGQLVYRTVNAGFSVFSTSQDEDESSAAGLTLSLIGPAQGESRKDPVSVLRVQMTSWDGTMVTATNEEILAGANLAAYGAPGRWEIVQVQTVTQVAGNVYDLSNLVRALRGTELASAQHTTNDLFILLDRPPVAIGAIAPLSSLGDDVSWKAVGLREDANQLLDNVSPMLGVFERMWAPRNVLAATSGSDTVFTWDRRSRLFSTLVDEYESVPTEGTARGFELELYGSPDSLTPVRTVTDLVEPTYTYTAADALTDFGGMPSTFNVRVYQNSSEVGRGVPAVVNIDAT